jgi:quercetin dioxygenase-like cupin family protein
MGTQAFFTAAADCGRPLNVVGEHISVLASGATTGSYEVFLQEGPDGSGPIPHTHPWDESFYVIRGEVDFSVDRSDLRTARPGDLVHVPAGTLQWFRWNRGGGAMLSMTSRLGASRLFADIDREIAPDEPDVERLIAIALRHGLTIAE